MRVKRVVHKKEEDEHVKHSGNSDASDPSPRRPCV